MEKSTVAVNGAAWPRTPAFVAISLAMFALAAPAAAQEPNGALYAPPGYSLSVPATTTSAPPSVPTTQAPPRAETQSIRGLWVPGLVGLPVSYVTTWIVANLSLPLGSSGVDLAYIPVIGPWLVLGQELNGGDEAFYATMGVVQGVSLVCLVLGLAIRIPKPATDAPSVSLRPSSSGGMSATLSF